MPRADEAIRIEGLSVHFGAHVAVSDLDLVVQRGEVFGFLGPNGAGKTSTIRAILGLVRPAAGRVRVLGEDEVARNSALRSRLAYLPGDLALFPFLTGRETLDFFAGLQGRPPRLRDEILDRLDFPRDALDRSSSGYSTGMRQMIGITVALQHDPELMILDEPTTGLDPVVRRELLALLRRLVAEGRTLLFSSHVLSEVESCADRVGLIAEGRLRLVDSVIALKARFPRIVRYRRRDGESVEFEHEGEIGPLIQRLGDEDLVDLEIRSPDLATLFDRLHAGEEIV